MCIRDSFVELARNQMGGSFLDPLRKFGGLLFLVLKGQLRGLFPGIRVNDRLPDLFLWDIGLRLICSGRSFLRFADRLFPVSYTHLSGREMPVLVPADVPDAP